MRRREQTLLRRAADALDSAAIFASLRDPRTMLVITPEAAQVLARLLIVFDVCYPADIQCAELVHARQFAREFLGETDNENSGEMEP
jgi:hypothetical protein